MAHAVMSRMLVRVPRYMNVKLSAAMRAAKVSVKVFLFIDCLVSATGAATVTAGVKYYKRGTDTAAIRLTCARTVFV